LEGYKTVIWAGFFLLLYGYPWLKSRWTGGEWADRSNRTGGGMALYHRHLKAQLRPDESQNGRFEELSTGN